MKNDVCATRATLQKSHKLWAKRRISAVVFFSATCEELQGCFGEFTLSELRGFFASLRMTSEGLTA